MKRLLIFSLLTVLNCSLSAQEMNQITHESKQGDEQDSRKAYGILRKILDEEFELYRSTLMFHWNVTGMNFVSLHKFFGKLYEQQQQDIDLVAERIRALGELVSLRPSEKRGFKIAGSDQSLIRSLLGDYEKLIYLIREGISIAQNVRDEGTVNLLSTMIERTEKSAWMLRAHLQGGK